MIDDRPAYRYEVLAGAETTGRAWSLYSTVTFAPLDDVRVDGLRLRSTIGLARYGYDGLRWNGSAQLPAVFAGEAVTSEVLVGWQSSWRSLTVKGFLGGTRISHDISPVDADNVVQGARIGLKAALETWLSLGDRAFLQLDAAWASAFESASLRSRAGWRLDPAWSTGLEAGYVATTSYEAARVGAFARFEWDRGEVSAAAGIGSDRSMELSAYGSMTVMMRF